MLMGWGTDLFSLILSELLVFITSLDLPEVTSKSTIYYEQMQYNERWYRIGDFVYVYNPLKNRTAILRADKLWKTAE